MMIRPRRSVLYMPGSNARALEKAKTSTRMLDLDLRTRWSRTRRNLAPQPGRGGGCRAASMEGANSSSGSMRFSSPWGRDDMAAAAAAGPDAILIPKVSTPGDIMKAAKELRETGASDKTRLWAMMETPLAVLNADAIVRTAADPASRLAALVMGTNDLAKESRARSVKGRPPMLAWLSILRARRARAWRRNFSTASMATSATRRASAPNASRGVISAWTARRWIHRVRSRSAMKFSRTAPAEVDWARKIIAAFALPENRDKGAISLEGRMVERLHADMARHTVAIAEAIAARAA